MSDREIEVRDLAHLLHLAVGNMYLRSHPDQTYLYENGAFVPFNGVVPESLFHRCKEYATYVEGCVCRLGIIIRGMADDGGIFDAVDLLFCPLRRKRVLTKKETPSDVGFPWMDFA